MALPKEISQYPLLTIDDSVRANLELNLDLFIGAAAENTQKAMLRALKAFQAFCWEHNVVMFPLKEDVLLTYISDRLQDDILGRSIESDISMLKMMDAIALNTKFSPMANNKSISLKLSAIKKNDRRKNKAAAIHFDTLSEWFLLNQHRSDDMIFVRNNALFRIAYDGMLRVSELYNISIQDVDIKSSTLLITHSKTDQESEGEYLYLRPETISAYQQWVKVLAKPKTEPLFWSFFKGGRLKQPLTERGIMKIIKEEFMFIDGVSSHSFRVGACEDLAAGNISMTQIMLSGRWKDPKMPTYYSKKINASKSGMAELAKLQSSK